MQKKIRKYICVMALIMFVLADVGAGVGEQQPPREAFRPEVVYTHPELRELVDSGRNVIVDDSSHLRSFFEQLGYVEARRDSVVSILHIGDSHVQAGFLTGRLRELFQHDFGNAGRGLITPLRLAGTNEPRDYAIRTQGTYVSHRISESGLLDSLGFTGVSFETGGTEIVLELWAKEKFQVVTVLHHRDAPALSEPAELSIGSYCDQDNTAVSTRIVLNEAVDSLSLRGQISTAYPRPIYYGFSLERGTPGVLYHAAGINGVTFEQWMQHTTLLNGGAEVLRPDLVVISLGTNSCFGNRFDADHVYEVATAFIKTMKASYPQASFLVTTPMEACRRTVSRGRRVYRPNGNIEQAAEAICRAASEQGVAYWDLYHAAGGEGAIERWYKHQLVGADRIHLTEKGYLLQAEMFYEAFVKYYNEVMGFCDTTQDEDTQLLSPMDEEEY